VLAIFGLLVLVGLALLLDLAYMELFKLCDQQTGGNLYQTGVCMKPWGDGVIAIGVVTGLVLLGAAFAVIANRAKPPLG
jgi:hypothetical protein